MATELRLVRGDITTLQVDVIVNAANSTLLGGGGVDGAIHYAAGPALLAECRTLGGCPPGEARMTMGHNLPARWIIHTVGPVWKGGDRGEARLLESCYEKSLRLAIAKKLKTIAFPAISTGSYAFPMNSATEIAVATVRRIAGEYGELSEIIFCCHSGEAFEAYQRRLGVAGAE
jgi:O-acetyl-ADP-ribose deacetylase